MSNESVSLFSFMESCFFIPFDWMNTNVDWRYLQWLGLLYRPLIICFLLPVVVLFLLYGTVLLLLVVKWRHKIRDSYNYDAWRGSLQVATALWDSLGRLWHSYEVEGLENLPTNGPAIVVYYHGAIPLDIYYFTARCILQLDRRPTPVVDRFLFRVPGLGLLLSVMGAMEGTIETCAKVLARDSNILLISPGGVREALFSDEYYTLLWGHRVGFAKVALRGSALLSGTPIPIYPMFTENVREALRTAQFAKSWLRKLYESTRLPLVPIYGFFPVKMRTVLGAPIMARAGSEQSPEQLALEVRSALNNLIQREQILPGNILRAICQRIPKFNRHLCRQRYLTKEKQYSDKINAICNDNKNFQTLDFIDNRT